MSFLSRHIDRQIAAYQRELVETHYQEVETMYRQMRGWRHDYRSHIQAMKALAADGDVEAIKDYLDQLDTELNTVESASAGFFAFLEGNRLAQVLHLPFQISCYDTKPNQSKSASVLCCCAC